MNIMIELNEQQYELLHRVATDKFRTMDDFIVTAATAMAETCAYEDDMMVRDSMLGVLLKSLQKHYR